MPDQIDTLRNQAEADLSKLLDRLSGKQRRAVAAAIDQYGSVRAVPPIVWEGLKRQIDEEASALLLLLLMGVYQTNARRIGRKATSEQRRAINAMVADDERLRQQAATVAAQLGREVADQYVEGARSRLTRNLDDKAGELNELPAKEASERSRHEIEIAIGSESGERTTVTKTTEGVTIGQGSAADDIGRSLGVEMSVAWVTEKDARVCPICRPLHGKAVADWDAVLAASAVASRDVAFIQANGGPPAHPRCRCSLRHFIVADSEN